MGWFEASYAVPSNAVFQESQQPMRRAKGVKGPPVIDGNSKKRLLVHRCTEHAQQETSGNQVVGREKAELAMGYAD
jgi:hypothetical protein